MKWKLVQKFSDDENLVRIDGWWPKRRAIIE